MAVLPIVRLGHPALRTPAEPVPAERLGTEEFQRLVADMVETMRAAEGVGLAAPQVGLGLQLFVYEAEIPAPAPAASPDPEHPADPEDPETSIPLRVIVNPMVEPHSRELVYDWEGCLSIPDLRGLVPRYPEVRVRATDHLGAALDFLAAGFEARIVQHEFDHLNGVVFLDRMRDLHSLAFFEEWEQFLNEGEPDPATAKPE